MINLINARLTSLVNPALIIENDGPGTDVAIQNALATLSNDNYIVKHVGISRAKQETAPCDAWKVEIRADDEEEYSELGYIVVDNQTTRFSNALVELGDVANHRRDAKWEADVRAALDDVFANAEEFDDVLFQAREALEGTRWSYDGENLLYTDPLSA